MSDYILGISAFYHDSAAALLKDGEIIAAVQEERFTRKKHDYSFPSQAVNYCLKEAQITSDQLKYIAFYDKPFIKFNRILETYLTYAPKGILSFVKAIPLWIRKKLWILDLIAKETNFDGTILFPEHHESHAASAFFPSPFKNAAFLTMDGVGEWATSSFGIGDDNHVKILSELHFPHSLGLLYSAFTYFTGFKVNSGEYKVMGLAPYGQPKYVQKIYDHLIDVKADGSFKMNMDYFNYAVGLKMTNHRFAELFDGPPRKPESALTQREMDLARSVQEVTEDIMLRMAGHVKKTTDQKNLCMAGGVALNCVGNGKILRSGLFENIWIQPAAGDAGGALGAALIAHYHQDNNKRSINGKRDTQKGSYLGPEYSDNDIKAYLDQNKIPYKHLSHEELLETVTKYLIEEKVIGWFQGRMEFGPRALGNRSIIGDARSADMQKKMNLKIKYRESFRPFAPSVLADHVNEWFNLDEESPYMLLVADVRNDKLKHLTEEQKSVKGLDLLNLVRSKIPAVTHIDNSARIQTVNRLDNPIYYDLIDNFYKQTGCPVIINTSFNVRGEPIVESPSDAYICFMRTEMDILVLGSYLLNKTNQPEFKDKSDWKREYELD